MLCLSVWEMEVRLSFRNFFHIHYTEKLTLKVKILPEKLNLILVAVSVASARDACSAHGLLLTAQSGIWT